MHIMIRTFILASAASLNLVILSMGDSPSASRPSTNMAVLADVPIGNPPIVMPVTFKGKEYPFILDTGATGSAFDISLKHLLGEPMSKERVITPGGIIEREFYYAPQAFVGKIDMTYGGKVCCQDMKEISRHTGVELRGIIGITALRPNVLQMDFDGKHLRILVSDANIHAEWGASVPIRFDEQNVPTVEVSVQGHSAQAALDTGANRFLTIPVDTLRDICRKANSTMVKTPSITVAGATTDFDARIGHIKVGAMEYDDIIVSSNEHGLWALGNGFFVRHTITMDLGNMRMYVKKGDRFGEKMELTMGGLNPLKDGNEIRAMVDVGGPADLAGIRNDDIVVKVDGKTTDGMSLGELQAILTSGDGKRIPLIIKRDGKILEFTITLKRLI